MSGCGVDMVGAFGGPRKWGRMWPRQIACRMQLAHFASNFTGKQKNQDFVYTREHNTKD